MIGMCAGSGARVVVYGRRFAAPWRNADEARRWFENRASPRWSAQPDGLIDPGTGVSLICSEASVGDTGAVVALLLDGAFEAPIREVVVPGLLRHLGPRHRQATAVRAAPRRGSSAELVRLFRLHAGAVGLYTGAGLSRASGVAALEGRDGLLAWTGILSSEPMTVAAKMVGSPESMLELCGVLAAQSRGAIPSPGHEAIAALVDAGWAATVWTSNVDGLHERTGVQPLPASELDPVDSVSLLVIVGVSRDEFGLVRAARRAGAVSVCIDVSDSSLAHAADIWIRGDVQTVLPAIARLLC